MRRLLTSLLFLFTLSFSINLKGQVSTYSFYQSMENYTMGATSGTPGNGGDPAKVFPLAWDDNEIAYGIPTGLNFTYNGTLYSGGSVSIGVSSNGWVAFKNGNPVITLTGNGAGGSYVTGTHNGMYLSGTANNNGIAGFNGNLAEQTFTPFTCVATNGSTLLSNIPVAAFANIRVGTRLSGTGIPDGTVVIAFSSTDQLITMSTAATASSSSLSVTPRSSIYAFIAGTAPYRKIYIQYTQVRRAGITGDNFNFQIIINEGTATTSNIQVRYGPCTTSSTPFEVQAGLRGNSSADYNARKTTTSWPATTAATANTDRLLLSSTVFPPVGTVFNWTKGPIPANNNCANAFSITPALTCSNTSGTTINANQEFPPSTCGGFTSTYANEVWYKFTANGTANYDIYVTGTGGFDPVLALYSAGCNAGNLISCVDVAVTDGTETINAGQLPAGEYYYRIYGWAGATGTFTTCVIEAAPCVRPSNQASSLNLTATGTTTISGSFTASSPAASGYLVIRTDGSNPSSPVDGIVYTPGTFDLGGYVEAMGSSTTFNSSELNVATNYCYYVFAYNNTACSGGPLYKTPGLNGCRTTQGCGAITTKTWSNGSSGGDFNTANNWSPAGVPTACNDVVISFEKAVTITMSASATINSLTITRTGSPSGTAMLDVLGNNLTVLNSTNVDASGGTNKCQLGSSTTGLITCKGNVTLGQTAAASGGNPTNSVGSGIAGTASTKFIFGGNLTFGPTSFISITGPGIAEFDGASTQNITWNNVIYYANFTNVVIGNQNNPTVNQITGTITPDNIKGNLSINGSSVLNMGTSQWNRQTNGGTFQMNGTSTLKLAGTASLAIGGANPGGVSITGNNMPAWFGTYAFASTSNVEYNSGNGVSQVVAPVANVPVSLYGNLILSNSTGSGNSIKSLSQNIGGISGNLVINSFATFDIAAFTANRNTAGGTFFNNANGIFRLSGSSGGAGSNNNFPKDFSTYSFANTSFTEYYGGAQGIYGTPVYGHLAIVNAGVKTAPAGDLVVKGNFANNGSTFAHNNGRVVLNGTNQSFAGVPYFNLDLTNGIKNTAGNSSIADSLKLNVFTTLSLSANDTITILSTAARTASVAQIPASATIFYNSNARFRVERYIPNHNRAWQFLAIPTRGQTVKAAWQEGAITANANPRPGYGTQLTSNLTNALSLGFDVLSLGNSPKTWNSVTADWDGISSTNINIYNQKGYMVFVRGDRSVTAIGQSPTSTILRTTGNIYDAVTTPPVTSIAAGKFESIGNPFASAIELDKITLSPGVARNAYVWDPKLTASGISAYGFGAYVTISSNGDGTYAVAPLGTSYTSGNTNIESGMAFLMNAPFSSGTVSFTENAKVTGSNLVTRPEGIRNITTNLYSLINNSPVLKDGVISQFDDAYSKSVDIMDAFKLKISTEMLSIHRNNHILVIERRPEVRATDTIFYGISQLRQNENYQFVISASRMARNGLRAVFEDTYLSTKTNIDLNAENVINFTIDGNAKSSSDSRFRLVLLPARQTNTQTVPGLQARQTGVKENKTNEQYPVSVFPNPVSGKKMKVSFAQAAEGSYKLIMSNIQGQVIFEQEFEMRGSKNEKWIDLPVNIQSSVYNLLIINPSGFKQTLNIVVD